MKKKKEIHNAGESKKKIIIDKLPSISRFIPERLSEEKIFLIVFLFIFICTTVIGYDLYKNLLYGKKLTMQDSQLKTRRDFWENEINIHPGYRDAYFNLALVSYQLKDFESSMHNLQKALEIDPNFEKGRKLQEILSN